MKTTAKIIAIGAAFAAAVSLTALTVDAQGRGLGPRGGGPGGPPDAAEQDFFFSEADANADGAVTLDEFLADHPDNTEALFHRLDCNGDGVLSARDCRHNARHRMRNALRAADANQDGEISLDEFLAGVPNATEEQFDVLDRNDDGVISREDRPEPGEGPGGQRDRMRQIFIRADVDQNREVTYEELEAVLPMLTQDKFDRMDRNGDGVLSPADRPEGAPGPGGDNRGQRIRRLLMQADADGNREVTFDELQAVLPELTQEQFDRMDRNGDGVISREDRPEPGRGNGPRGQGRIGEGISQPNGAGMRGLSGQQLERMLR